MVKLKQLHWDRIKDIQNTFWDDNRIDDFDMIEKLEKLGILNDFEIQFKAYESKMKNRASQKSNEDTKSEEKNDLDSEIPKISFLDNDMKHQFAINLHHFNSISTMEFISKVLNCEVLSGTVLNFFLNDLINEITPTQMKNFGPYSKNIKMGHLIPKLDPNVLERHDRIYVELFYNLNHYWKPRTRCLLLATNYQFDYDSIVTKLDILDEVLIELNNSSNSFIKILEIIKTLGNFMNDESKMALGFKLGTLQRLKFLKNSSNKYTLLHYIERIIRTNFEEYQNFSVELQGINKVSTLNIDDLEREIKEFSQLCTNCIQSLTSGSLSQTEKHHPEDKIVQFMKPLIEPINELNVILIKRMDETLANLDKTMMFYGEDPEKEKNDFFMKFTLFIKDYQSVHNDNVRLEEEESLKLKRQKYQLEQKQQQQQQKVQMKELESNNDINILFDKLKDKRTDSNLDIVKDKMFNMMNNSQIDFDSVGDDNDDERNDYTLEKQLTIVSRLLNENVLRDDLNDEFDDDENNENHDTTQFYHLSDIDLDIF